MSLTTPLGKSIRNDIENWTEPTIQPTIVHLKQATGTGNSDWNHFPIMSLNSGINVLGYGRNIHNLTEMKPHVTIVTTIPESNISNY